MLIRLRARIKKTLQYLQIDMALSDKFYSNYSKIRSNLTHQFIPTKEVYDEMLDFLVQEGKSIENIDNKGHSVRILSDISR